MKRAVIIGLSLQSAINDAIAMKDMLESLDYAVILLLNSSATYDNIIKTLNWLSKSDQAIFHFSGHSKDKCLLCYDDIKLNPRKILKHNIIVFLDCCGGLEIQSNKATVIYNSSALAYDRIINGIRRGLLTYSLLGTLRRYNYSIDMKDLTQELNAKLYTYDQRVKIVSTRDRLEI